MNPSNFIYFFTVCGFFIGLMFSILNFRLPEDMLFYTMSITLFFYLFIHVIIMNFIDVKQFGIKLFNKKEYEDVSEYFVGELDNREKKMDSLLLEVEKMNKKYVQETQDPKITKMNGSKVAA